MWVSGGGEPFLALGLGPGASHGLLPWAGWPDIPLPAGKPELPRQPGSSAQYDAEAGPADAEPPELDSLHSSGDTDRFLHTLDWRGG